MIKSLDADAVKAFVLIAELHSFTRAAEALDSTQSAVSLKLRRLESRLGRRLLERTPRQVRLSAEGAVFLEAARQLVGAHEIAIAAFDTERRKLVIGISHQIVGGELPSMLRRMTGQDPRLSIELRVAGSREVAQSFEQGALDAAVVLQAEAPRRKGTLLFAESFAWIAAAGWQPPPGQPLLISTQGESCSIRAAAVRALDRAGIAWQEVFIGKGAAVVGAAAAAGLAVAVLPRRTAPAGTMDVGEALALPRLPTHKAVLYTALRDPRSRNALRILTTALKGIVV